MLPCGKGLPIQSVWVVFFIVAEPRRLHPRCATIQRIWRMTSMRPSYLRVFLTFARNSLVRDMMFPANFLIEAFSSMAGC